VATVENFTSREPFDVARNALVVNRLWLRRCRVPGYCARDGAARRPEPLAAGAPLVARHMIAPLAGICRKILHVEGDLGGGARRCAGCFQDRPAMRKWLLKYLIYNPALSQERFDAVA